VTLRESLFLIGGIFSGFFVGAFWAFRIVCRDAMKRNADLRSRGIIG
jgi:hypothetical protein